MPILDRNRLKSLMEPEQKRFADERPKSKAVFECSKKSLLSGRLLPFSFRMNVPSTKPLALLALCMLLAGCAQTGAPLPPSLELPKPPSDLRAVRKGNSVALTWSEPTLTTDHESLRSLGATRICRSAGADMTACENPVASVPPPTITPKKSAHKSPARQSTPQTFTDTLPPSALSDNPEAELTYAVEVLNRAARGAGPSNRVHIPANITLSAPADLAAQPNEDGVLLTWTSTGAPAASFGTQFRYRIYRRDENAGKEMVAGEVPVGVAGPVHFLDAIEWERTYLYRITAVSIVSRSGGDVQVEGDDSPTVRVVAHDVFPPAVPAGLQAVYSGEGQKPFIDLIWAPVASADLAGYNVFHSEADAEGKTTVNAAVKLNSELVKAPSYRDSSVSSGKTYVYAVSAVDARGNESARSDEASETVPASK